jgi:hypothetical protein
MTWDSALTCGLALRCIIDRTGVVDVEPEFAVAGDDYQPRFAAGAERDRYLAELQALSSTLPDVPSDEDYERELRRLIARNRRQSYFHLMTRLAEYPGGLGAQILWDAVRRKGSELLGKAANPGPE